MTVDFGRGTQLYVLRVLHRRLCERLLKVMDDIVNMFCADGDANQIFCDTTANSLFFRQLLVSRGPRMNGQCLRVPDAATW